MTYTPENQKTLISIISEARKKFEHASFLPVYNQPGKPKHKHPMIKTYIPTNAGYKPQPVSKLQNWMAGEHNALLGVVPATIGFVVVDIDHVPDYTSEEWDQLNVDEPAKAAKLLQDYINTKQFASFITRSQRPGHLHLWYKDDSEYPNKVLECGDLRSCNGFIIIWNPAEFHTGLKKSINKNPLDLESYLPLKKNKVVDMSMEKGNRNNTLYKLASKAGTLNNEAALDKAKFDARQAGLPEEEVEKTADTAFQNSRSHALASLVPNRGPTGYSMILSKLNLDARRNEFLDRTEVLYKDKWQTLNTRISNVIRGLIQTQFFEVKGKDMVKVPCRFSQDELIVAHTTLSEANIINPPSNYLRRLSDDCASGVDCDNYLPFLFNIPDTAYNRAAGRLIVLSAVTRLLNGSEKDEATDIKTSVILQGPGNIGKSTFVKLLLPPFLRGYLSQNLDLKAPEEQIMEECEGSIICEMQEMGDYSQSHSAKIKGFLSRGTDKRRKKYDREAEVYPRTTIFIGTTNSDVFIADDPALALRFMPVEIQPHEEDQGDTWIGDFMKEHRDSIWLSAVKLYDLGVLPTLTSDIMHDHNVMTSQFSHQKEEVLIALDIIYELNKAIFECQKTVLVYATEAGLLQDGVYKAKRAGVNSRSIAREMKKDSRFRYVGQSPQRKPIFAIA